MKIAITTPTGQVGSKVVAKLLGQGADLTLLIRDPNKLEPDVRHRVKIAQGEQQDSGFVTRATEGMDALFWVSPNDPTTQDVREWYEQLGSSVAQATEANMIPFVVVLSSAGAQLPHAGPVSGIGQIEEHLNATAANVVYLRPGYFMENALMQLDAIRAQNAFYGIEPPDLPMPHIATKDIAAVAAETLLKRAETGKIIRGLHGPADLTYGQIAQILGNAAGRPIQYVQISPEQARKSYLEMGLSPAFADAYVEMGTAFSKPGGIAEPRTAATTTPTTLEEWAKQEFVPALKG